MSVRPGETFRPLTWRVENVPEGMSHEDLISNFHCDDQEYLKVKSLCPSVETPEGEEGDLTGTVFFYSPEAGERPPRFATDDMMNIDNEFFGFTPLYVPPPGKGPIVADIIAITGLAGHAFGSWAHSHERMWLRDYLPADAPNARILTYGYSSRLHASTSISILQDYTNAFVHRLIDMRASGKCESRPIIFVGHSLGCLIVKKALTGLENMGIARSLIPVQAFIFLGAPHRGLNVTALKTLVKGEPTAKLIAELEADSATLTDLNQGFAHIAKDIDILTCYETRSTKTAINVGGVWKREGPPVMMVSPSSAQQYYLKEKCVSVDADHSQIAKLKRGQNGVYPNVKSAIKHGLISAAKIMTRVNAGSEPTTAIKKGLTKERGSEGRGIGPATSSGRPALEIARGLGDLRVRTPLLQDETTAEFQPRLIIAIEFGFHSSSVAYLFEEQRKRYPELVLEWPGSPGLKAPRTPNVINYNVREKDSFTWGRKASRESDGKIEGIREFLDPEQPVPLYVPLSNSKKELQKLGKPAVDVASDYLGALYKHTLDYINGSYPKDFVEMHQERFILTVPAIWSSVAKENLRKAAMLAGLYPFTLIKETFAAALFTLYSIKEINVSAGDAFVFCFIGHGTIDLCSFEYTKSGLGPNEIVLMTGGILGTSILSRRFEDFVKNIIGLETSLELKKTEGFIDAMKTFDQVVMPSFGTKSDQSWNISFPMCNLEDDPVNNLESNCLRLTNQVVQEIFEPVISAFAQLVTKQVYDVIITRIAANHPKAREVKGIVLISPYTSHGLSPAWRRALENAHPDIQIIEPPDPFSAVVRGAVLSQIPLEL